MDREDSMASARRLVRVVVRSGPVLFSLKETVECFFFVATLGSSETFHVNLSLLIVLHGDISACLLVCGHIRKHIKHKLVVDFYE